jgi:hypothetical protein
MDKALEEYVYLEKGYILSIDGIGYFESYQIHCKNCCERHRRNGKTAYYHQMLAASLVCPEKRQVIPLCPEPIIQEDHPYLKIVTVEDTLYGVSFVECFCALSILMASRPRLKREAAKPSSHEILIRIS